MNKRVKTKWMLPLFVFFGLALAACSSDSNRDVDAADASTPSAANEIPRDDAVINVPPGLAPNTGIVSQPLANGIAQTANRPATIDLDYLTDDNGFSTRLPFDSDLFGRDFIALGDVTGDGLPDFSIRESERTLIIFGGTDNLQTLDVDNVTSEQGIAMDLDIRFFPVGDLDGDGIGELAWLTFDNTTNVSGAMVVKGRSGSELQAAIENPSLGVDAFTVSNTQRLGHIRSVASAGDFTADGFGDVLIGGFGNNSADPEVPNAWVIYGDADIFSNTTVDVSRMALEQGVSFISPLTDEEFAAIFDSVSTGFNTMIAGNFDFNADGIDDVAIGTHWFDWIKRTEETRTYVLYGSSAFESNVINMRNLNGTDGLRVVGPSSGSNTFVSAVGDIDGNGFVDFATYVDNQGVLMFSGTGLSDAVVDGSALPAGNAMQIIDSSGTERVASLSELGDLDGNGADELGITQQSGRSIIVYGDQKTYPATLDLSNLDSVDTTVLVGIDTTVFFIDENPLHALGDINNDGLDDLGVGWTRRVFDAGVRVTDDINADGVADLELNEREFAEVYLWRVVYGFGADGFTGHVVVAEDTQALVRVGDEFFNALIDSINLAANYAVDTLNNDQANGVELGATAAACIANGASDNNGDITELNCADTPLSFAYDWVGRRSSGTQESLIRALSVSDGIVQRFSLTSTPLSESPFGAPFLAFVDYDASGDVVLSNGRDEDSANFTRQTCTINTNTHIATGKLVTCESLISRTTTNLNFLFGEAGPSGELILLP